jgi:hypothetical protein
MVRLASGEEQHVTEVEANRQTAAGVRECWKSPGNQAGRQRRRGLAFESCPSSRL